MTSLYRIRGSDLAHETIDGETVVVDMARGSYYRMEGAAAMAWEMLVGGASRSHLVARLESAYATGGDAGAVERAVEAFLADLISHQLIEAAEAADGASPDAPDVGNSPESRPPFPGLALHQFTDLEELFLIDPVHEVDETGWPTQPPRD